MIQIEAFDGREALTDTAARAIAEQLTGGGLFIATGGSTPGPVYDRLSQMDLPWTEISVTLTDERFVDPAAEDSNGRMVRARLLTAKAAGARFLPLRAGGRTPAEDALAAEAWLLRLPPAAVELMGMGEDGHVASLFPDAPELAEGLEFDGERLCLPVPEARLAPLVPRITLTARALIRTRLIVLLITGEDKRAMVERIGREEAYAPPAATFLRQDRCPVRVLWAA
ncbi:MAG TPA: 6-phosphogluconolactonase [Caulobacteraceae bacterium]